MSRPEILRPALYFSRWFSITGMAVGDPPQREAGLRPMGQNDLSEAVRLDIVCSWINETSIGRAGCFSTSS